MFDETQKEAANQAYMFACKVGKERLRNISNNDNTFHSEHSPAELKKRVFDLAVEYHNWKAPSTNDGLISNLESIKAELKGLITKFDALKSTAPDTFDDIAYLMYSPYLRGGELKAQTFTYYDPQTELEHLVRAIGLTKSKTQARARTVKKRGIYWHRIEQVWAQITSQPPKTAQNSDFIKFSEMVFNSGKRSEDDPESSGALSKDYRRYLEKKRSTSLQPSRLDKND